MGADDVLVQAVAWWAVAAIAGAASFARHRLVATAGVLISLAGLTAMAVAPRAEQPVGRDTAAAGIVEEETHYVAARIGSREYHLGKCIDAKYIEDPLVLTTEQAMRIKGYVPHRCVLAGRAGAKKG